MHVRLPFRLPFRLLLLSILGVVTLPVAAAAQFSANTYYHIKPRHAVQAGYNLCLDVENLSAADGARIQQYTCNTSWPQDNQLWTLVPAASGTFRLVSAISAKCLDVLNPSNGSGAPMQQWACNLQSNQPNQVFTVAAAPTPGYYRITSAHSGGSQCLDVPYSSLTAGQDVQQWACGPWWQDNQDWQIAPTWLRAPVGHIQYFGWYGESTLPSLVSDHVNMIVYTIASLEDIANAPASIKAKLAFNDMIVYQPGNGDLLSYSPADGGLRSDVCQYWSQNRSALSAYMSRVGAFYVDEPIWNLYLKGWSVADAQAIVQTLAEVVKGQSPLCAGLISTQDAGIPFAVVESPLTAHIQLPAAVDWVGFDCNDCDTPGALNFLPLWNTQKSQLRPNQKLVIVPPATFEISPIPPPNSNWPNCELSTAASYVTPQQDVAVAAKASSYLTVALAEPKLVAVWPWHGVSRYYQYSDPGPNGTSIPINNPCDRDGIYVGALDLPNVKNTWRFLARSIGFGL
jgi:hypothetical protein